MTKFERFMYLETKGIGGSSFVYKVWDHKYQRLAILKIVSCKSTKQKVEQIKTIQLQMRLNHRSIITVYDWWQKASFVYSCMNYIEGTTLMEKLDAQQVQDSNITTWILQLIAVFQYLHKHEPPILYIDLKPQNILCDKQQRIYLFDFDSCVFQDIHYLRSATKGYASPEVYEQKDACIQSDIYSFGICIYVLLHGGFPNMKDANHAFDAWLRTCFSKHKRERYRDFTQVKKAYLQITEGGDA